MSSPDLTESPESEQLSALIDGELDAESVNSVCLAWREKASVRADWHAFQLIGDVLRSEDLAMPTSRDASFLSSLRERLADEPVVLAPAVRPQSEDVAAGPSVAASNEVRHAERRRRRMWFGTSAVAAGFVAVAGTLLVVSQERDDHSRGAITALVPNTVGPSAVRPVVEQPVLVSDGAVLRDPQLDRYLSAHKQFSSASVLGGSSGFLRNAAVEVPQQ